MSGSEERSTARVPTGVSGLDEMLGGGFPQGHVVLVAGLPGTGKTCLALGFLMAGIARGESGLFLSLEEEVPALLASARGFGWPADAAVEKKQLTVLRLDPKETKGNLHRIQSDLPKEIAGLGVRRIAVDSVSLLNMLSDDEPGRRATLFSLAAACRGSGATTLLTAEADPLHPGVSRDGLTEYVSDGVILLGYNQGSDGHKVGLSLRVLKMRRTAHLRSVQPYVIGPKGIEVDARAVDFGL
ncbi:MAG: KaiC domain-containing protein [Thermoplasmata archaeon]|nr:KaiC domain-containing protein [Thermoplasmata archaeon]MCI4338458.1 KaiC domain-containing protein [Thermoplasmata archaeon]MCI4341545.1 KaiC domain-containing protein [Thermoplasmata archaeon]